MIYRGFLIASLAIVVYCDGSHQNISSKKAATNFHFFKWRSQFKPVIQFDEYLFKKHILRLPRNFFIVVEFTISNSSKCHYCKLFQHEFTKLAEGYKDSKQSGVFFVTLNLADSMPIFNMFNVHEIPKYFVFMNEGKNSDHRPFRQMLAIKAEIMAKNLRHFTGIKVDLRNAAHSHKLVAAIALGFLGLGMTQSRLVRRAISHRYFWGVLSVTFIALFTSGTMANYMQQRPFSSNSYAPKLENYVQRGGQYVVETVLIFMIYVSSTVCIIVLHSVYKLYRWKPVLKCVLEMVFCSLLLVIISFLVRIYRFKFPDYEYRLLFP